MARCWSVSIRRKWKKHFWWCGWTLAARHTPRWCGGGAELAEPKKSASSFWTPKTSGTWTAGLLSPSFDCRDARAPHVIHLAARLTVAEKNGAKLLLANFN